MFSQILKTLGVVVFLFFNTTGYSEKAIWSDGTAFTLPKGRYEFGIFQPLRYGLTDKTEISSFPLWNILIPNITIKKVWDDPCCYYFATQHSFNYPTPLLKFISNRPEDIFPDFTTVPELFVFSNHLIFSKYLEENHLVTTKFGVNIAINKGNVNMPAIDLPVVFPRTNIYQNGLSFNLGIDFDGLISKKYYYLFDMDFFILSDIQSSYAFENKGLIIWKRNDHFSILLGYAFTYGEYPSGTGINILPLIDLQWGRNCGK